MKLEGLLSGQSYRLLQGKLDVNISGIAYDSRKVDGGKVFVAIKGFEQDGHMYIGQSIQKGVSAIVLEDPGAYAGLIPEDITVVQVENGRIAMAAMACNYYNSPSNQFELVGVTGTNGKTTTVFLINNVLEYYGRKTGLIGTISNKIDKEVVEATRTTPESLELQELFSKMADANVNDVIMEVSSHALDLYRVAYSKFDIGVFTNLTLDHLDYHKTMENYKAAKAKLFDMCKIGVINIDDEAGKYMMENSACSKFITTSIKDKHADLYADHIESRIDGVSYILRYKGEEMAVHLMTPGIFSVYNSLSAIGVLLELKLPLSDIVTALGEVSTVRGRFQALKSPLGYTAIVDYAHAPDGLLNVLETMTEFKTNKIITVFGCGGDRDKSKRPIMGEIAGNYSDFCVITSDNPRTEDEETIIDDVEAGMKKTSCPYERIADREAAIIKGLSMAKEGDLVLVAGKGHEDYQIIGKKKYHFDDRQVILEHYEEKFDD